MRLPRPYIPLKVRVQVARRQVDAYSVGASASFVIVGLSSGQTLKALLKILFDDRPYALDHDPALVNRKRYVRNGKTFYKPAANDPRFLLYREAGPGSDHDIKTRVRGDGARRSDLGQRRYDKRVAKNRAKAMRPTRSKKEKRAAADFFKSVRKIANPTTLRIVAIRSGKLKIGDTLTWPSRSGKTRRSGKIRFIVWTDKSKPKRKWGSRPMQSKGFR